MISILLGVLYNGIECLDLSLKFDYNSIYDASNPDGASFDNDHNAFPSDYLPCDSYIKDPRYDIWFKMPSAHGNDSWKINTSGETVDVPNGKYLTLHVLAAAGYGSQTFTLRVHYTDSTTQDFTFQIPDWAPEYDPKVQPGGDAFLVTPFRYTGTAGGTPSKDWKPVRIYSVAGALEPSKYVDYIEVTGANSNVAIFAISLRPAQSTGNFTKIDLSSYYNIDGVAASATGTGNFDGGGYAFPDDSTDDFPFGEVTYVGAYYAEFLINASENGNNFIAPSGQTIDVPDGKYKHIFLAVSGAVGDHTLEITLNRADGSTQKLTFTVPDWCVGSGLEFKRFTKRFNTSDGTTDSNNNPKIFLVDAPVDDSVAITSMVVGGEDKARVLAISFSDSDPVWLSKYGFLSGLTSKDWRVDRLVNLFKYSILAFTIPCDSSHFNDSRTQWTSVFDEINIDDYYNNPEAFFAEVEQAYSKLENALINYGAGTSGIMDDCVYYFPQSHLDYIWLWRWPSTIEKARFTFERNLNYMDQDPHYIFVQSTPAYFEWMKQYYPDLFERIKSYVLSGRFKLVGGYLNEPDQNLPSGEGLVRSRLYGYRLYKELFGESVARDAIQIEWLPDTFGFSASLPQIMAKSGVKLFVTTKLNWVAPHGFYPNYWNFNIVRWKSLDGSEILAYQTSYGLSFEKDIYVSQLLEMSKPGNFDERNRFTVDANKEFKLSDYDSYQDKNNNSIYQSNGIHMRGILIGLGDGGSGVTPEGYWRYTVYSLAGGDLIKGGSPQQFYQELMEKVGTQYSHIPVWNDELYLMYHRACYTHASVVKHWLRKCESSLEWSEKACALASLLGYPSYDPDDFYRMWKKFAVNYFHDIAPGSAIAEAYADQVKFMQEVSQEAEQKGKDALQFVAAQAKTNTRDDADGSILIFNPLSWKRSDPVWLEWDRENYVRVYDDKGNEIPVQFVEQGGKRYLVFVAHDVPSMGYKVYTYKEYTGDYPPTDYSSANPGYDDQLSISGGSMHNSYYDLTLNTVTGSGVGAIINQIYDKVLGKNLIENGDNVSLAVYGGYPDEYPAWNYEAGSDEPSYVSNNWTGYLKLESVSTTQNGPVFVEKKYIFSYRRTTDFGDSYKWPVDPQTSTIEVYVRLYAKLRKVFVKFRWNWYGYNALVKVRYPLSVAASFAHTEIPYGEYDRPLVPTNEAEKHRWEFPAQRWVDLDEGSWGVTISNFAKYGWDVLECSNGVNSPTGKHVVRASLIWFPEDHGNHDDNYYHDPKHWWEEENQEAVFTISSHGGDWMAGKAWKRGYELNVPLVSVFSDIHDGQLPPVYSFMSYSGDEDMAITAFKKSEDGEAYMVRVFNYATSNKTMDYLYLPFQIEEAYETDLLEENKVASVEFENSQGISYLKNIVFAPTEIKTFRILPEVSIEVEKPAIKEVVDGTLKVAGRVYAPGQQISKVSCTLIKDGTVFEIGESGSQSFNFTYDVSKLTNGWATLRISAGSTVKEIPVYIGNGYGSAFSYVDPGWNSDAWGYTKVEMDGDVDGVGTALPADLVPASGSLWMPSSSGMCYRIWNVYGDAFNSLKITSDRSVDLPDGMYYRAGLLFISVNGASSAQLRLNYSDGSYKDITLEIPDWCDASFVSSSPINFPYRDLSKGLEKVACAIKEYVVDLDSSKTLKDMEFSSVSVPASGGIFLLGISLEKVPQLLQAFPTGGGADPGVLPWAEFSAPVFVGQLEIVPDKTTSWYASVKYEDDFCRVSAVSERLPEPLEKYRVVLYNCRSATGRNLNPFAWDFSTSSSPLFAFLETPQDGAYYRDLKVRGAVLGTTLKSFTLRLDGKTVLTSSQPTRYSTIYSLPSASEGVHTVELSVVGDHVMRFTRTFTIDRTPASLKKIICGGKEVGSGDRVSSNSMTLVLYDRVSGVDTSSVSVKVNGKSVKGTVSKSGEETLYTCTLDAHGKVNVEVNLRDVAGNLATYSFDLLVEVKPSPHVTSVVPFPNPAREKVCITYVLGDDASDVRVKVFDLSGRKIAVLKGGTSLGYNKVWWDLTNAFGKFVANGVYVIEVEAVFEHRKDVAKTKVLVMK